MLEDRHDTAVTEEEPTSLKLPGHHCDMGLPFPPAHTSSMHHVTVVTRLIPDQLCSDGGMQNHITPQHSFARGTGAPHPSVNIGTPHPSVKLKIIPARDKAGRRCAGLSCLFEGSSPGPSLIPSQPLPLHKLLQFPFISGSREADGAHCS